MLIENEFTVAAPPDDVYALMTDVERVAPCLPGTTVLGRRDEGGFDGQMQMKLGPMKMTYRGSVEITAQDAQARTATMVAQGIEARGQGSAQGDMRMSVTGDAGASVVTVATEIQVTGRVAQMGQGIMKDVAARLMTDMARNMEDLLVSPVASAEAAVAAGAPLVDPATPAAPRPTTPAATSDMSLGVVLRAVVAGRLAALRRWLRARRSVRG